MPRKAFRSRQRAEVERLSREIDARDDYDELERLKMEERLERAYPFAAGPVPIPDLERGDEGEERNLEYPLMFEVIEVELDGAPEGGR